MKLSFVAVEEVDYQILGFFCQARTEFVDMLLAADQCSRIPIQRFAIPAMSRVFENVDLQV